MRRIKRGEIKKVSRKYAEMFADYPLYDLYGMDRARKLKAIYCGFCYETYVSASYNYTVDDRFSGLCSVKTPDDADVDAFGLFANPVFTLYFRHILGKNGLALAKDYLRFTEVLSAKYCDFSTDCYVKNVGVAREARGKGLLKLMLAERCGDRPVYLETHSLENVAIYEKLGFKLLETADFHGLPHYVMKRNAK